jgi:hypothetical protein
MHCQLLLVSQLAFIDETCTARAEGLCLMPLANYRTALYSHRLGSAMRLMLRSQHCRFSGWSHSYQGYLNRAGVHRSYDHPAWSHQVIHPFAEP